MRPVSLAKMTTMSLYVVAAIALAPLVLARADVYEWIEEGTGNWNVPSNWDPYPPAGPNANDDAVIENGGTCEITTGDPEGGRAFSIFIGFYTVDSSGTVRQTGGVTDIVDLHVGCDEVSTGTGEFKLEGGTVILGGATHQEDGDLYIYENGTLEQTGGSISVDFGMAILGGGYVLDDGTLWAYAESIHGDDSTGTFEQSGGYHEAEILWLYYEALYELSGGTLCVTNDAGSSNAYVGGYGVGVFEQSGGLVTIDNNLVLGGGGTGTGLYTLDGGTLTAGDEYVYSSGSTMFLHYAGSNTINDDGTDQLGGLYVHGESGDEATYVLGDPTDQSATPQLTAELEAIDDGVFKHIGGTNTISTTDPGQVGELFIESHGTYLLGLSDYGTASPELNADSEYIGDIGGMGVLVQDHGTNTATKVFIGYDAYGSYGTYTMDGGNLIVEKLFIADQGTDDGTTNYGRGAVGIYGTLDIDDATADIQVGNKVTFGLDAAFEATAGSEITITLGEDDTTAPETGEWLIRFVDDGGHNPNDLDGLGDLTLNCEFAESIVSGTTYNVPNELLFEACGEGKDPEEVTVNDFTSANFVIDKLVVGRNPGEIDDAAGKITVKLMDAFDNQDDGTGETESVYVKTLVMKAGAAMWPMGDTVHLYYRNGGDPKQFRVGDTYLDGVVDILDLTNLATNWGLTGREWKHGDFNGDRTVDILDLTDLATGWGGEGDLGTSVEITVDESTAATPDLAGYVTIDVTLSTEDTSQILCGFDLRFDADTMNQVTPYGASTIFEDSNWMFPFVPASVEQDSQFELHTVNDWLIINPPGEYSEDGTSLAAVFVFNTGVDNPNASDEVLVAHVVVPSDVEVSLTGSVVIFDAATNEWIDTVAVDETLNEQ